MAIEPAVRHHPAPWIVLGPVLFASLLSVGLALLAVFGTPPWTAAPGTAGRPIGPPAAGQGVGPPVRPSTGATATATATAAPLSAARPGTAYRSRPATSHQTDSYQRALLLSGLLGLTIAIVGLTMVGRRRQMW